GYPDRIIAKPAFAAQLKQRTLTNLYNKKPAWLVNAHVKLDQAVAAAYGWGNDAAELNEADILQRLLALNLARGKCA
ncbi:adenine methyltransferase, partial [Chromatium okenii]|uniref:adenine methyltransferase n=1 Tax=Chromatium okenii TaxID=61644 RepID=UPI0026F0488F